MHPITPWRAGFVFVAIVLLATARLGAVVINFDERPAQPPPFVEGAVAESQFIVNNQYASLGVLFSSGGGGILIGKPSNPVSSPNTASATGPGPVVSYLYPVDATFVTGGNPAVVDAVSLKLTNSSSPSRLDAFDAMGALVASSIGGASALLSVSAPGQIHSVRINQGPMAFDDFTFTGLAPVVPEPSLGILVLGAIPLLRRRNSSRRRIISA